jgi:gamma-glutamyltranspeptidase/glutathione hydrolase
MFRAVLTLAISLSLLACGAHLPPPAPESAGEAPGNPLELLGRPDVIGTQGAVVAGHPLAAAAGADVLRRGGNAVDAVVTMAAVLAVVRPHMNGVGGDAFALFYDGETGAVNALNASGRAGALASPELFAGRGITVMPQSGALSVTVPGAVSAWAAALERYGTITFAEALEPAIYYAAEGFPVSWRLESDIGGAVRRLNDGGRAIFMPRGEAPRAGEIFRSPALAGTLRTLAHEGPGALYGGEVGRALADFLEGEGGHLRLTDFARHEPEWTDPPFIEFQGKRVYTAPPNSQGSILLQQLGIAGEFPLAEFGHNSAEYLHTLVEAKKLAFADRDRWFADSAVEPAPLDRLLEPAYLRERARLVGPKAGPGATPGFGEPIAADIAAGDGDTVYLMAVDQWGNAVSWIQSLFSSFGSQLVEPSTGIVLQNRGGGFTLQPGHPNQIAAGKRPFHTLMPVLVTDAEGRLEMTVGTPGGHGQSQTVLQVLNNVYLFGMTPQQAIEAPRFQHSNGVMLNIEAGIAPAVRQALTDRGHRLRITSGWTASFGGAQMIRVVGSSPRVLYTGADPRREGYAVAY